MKTKRSFLQKIILSIITILMLFNFIFPISMYVFANTSNLLRIEELDGISGYGQGKFIKCYKNGQTYYFALVYIDNKVYGLEYYVDIKGYLEPYSVEDARQYGLKYTSALEYINTDTVPEKRDGYKISETSIIDELSESEIKSENWRNYYSIRPTITNQNKALVNEAKANEQAEIDTLENPESEDSGFDIGGVLLSPIVDLLCSLGDVVINILQWCMMGYTEGATNFSLSAFMKKGSEWTGEASSEANVTVEGINTEKDFDNGWLFFKNDYYIPVTTYSPEEIFSGQVAGLDINFINPNKYTDNNGKDVPSVAKQLQSVIAGWYVALRNLAIVGLLSVLVYVGIRIILSSNSQDKAKYKQMLVDWVIALCLLFFLHYIMSFTITMVESITNSIAGNGSSVAVHLEDESGPKSFSTNLLGLARFQTQYKSMDKKVSYLIMYLALVVYTVIFTWFYLKRVLMMAFLTLIAPLVALTYPIDKMQDGKAQAFNAWLKEYIFNALIQPFHLIIYMVFVGSAMDLASTNIIYMIAALGFILPAEKILRGFFGFNKAGAGTLGQLIGGAAIGGALGKGVNSIISGKKSPQSGGGNGGNASVKSENAKPPRFERKHDVSQINSPKSNMLKEGSTESKETKYKDNKDNNNRLFDESNTYDDYGAFPDEDMANYYNDSEGAFVEAGAALGGAAIADRMAEIEANEMNPEYNPEYISLKDQLARQQEEQVQNKKPEQSREQEKLKQGQTNGQIRKANMPEQENNKQNSKNSKIKNWARGHNISGRTIARGALRAGGRTIGGAAKFATRTAFKAGAGALAGAVSLATGGGFAGAAAAYSVASSLGGKLAEPVVNAGSAVARNVSGATGRLASTRSAAKAAEQRVIAAGGTQEQIEQARKVAMQNELFAGTAIGRELDLANGNTRYQEAGRQREFKSNKSNLNYLRDQMASQNGGQIPSQKEVTQKMEELSPYISEGITDIKEALKAQRAEQYGVSAKQSAIIASIGKEKNITEEILNDEKKSVQRQANLAQEYRNKGYSEKDATKQAEYVMNVLKAQNGVAHNLQKPIQKDSTQKSEQTTSSQSSASQSKIRPSSSSQGSTTQAMPRQTTSGQSSASQSKIRPSSSSQGSATQAMPRQSGTTLNNSAPKRGRPKK